MFRTEHKITIGVLIMFIGLCLLSSNYLSAKKLEVFDEMNELYYEQLVDLETELEELEDEVVIPGGEEAPIELPLPQPGNEPTTTKKPTAKPVDYTKYYVGYLSIPKINLKKGFTEINNKYNNVNRNIQVMKPSNYPDVALGNMIIAGHSGSTAVSFFKDLYKLKKGDALYITYEDVEYTYIISNIYTVPKTGKVKIVRDVTQTTLTLITCTKGNSKTQTVYIAERV